MINNHTHRNSWLVFLVLALLAAVSSPVMAQKIIDAPGVGAGSAWTVYAYGNAQAVADSFRAIANFTNSTTFQNIVSLVAVIGVLVVGASSGFSGAIAKRFVSYTVFVFFICYILFGVGTGGPLAVKVEVIDVVDNTWVAPVTVPAVVGIPAALVSGAGQALTEQIEASFTIPDELKLSKGAPFNLAASLMSDITQARISDPNLANSLAYYVQDCFTIAAVRGDIAANVLLHSTDFLSDISTDLVGVHVNTTLGDPVGVSKVVSCVEAHSLIEEAVNAHGNDASAFLSNASAWARTPALSIVNAAADATAQWASSGAVTNGGDMIKQVAMLSTFAPAFSQAAAATGNSDFLTGIAVTQATESQRNGWLVAAEIFNTMMGYVFAILQVFIYAITPLILVAALVPSLGLSLLKNFGQVLIWLAIWQPMLAIVNFIVISLQQTGMGGALGSGITMSTLGIVSERTSNMVAAGSFIGTMVPILAWAFVKGSVDFSRVLGSAIGENFSQQAGNTLTTGNYSLNQASMDSFTANKTSIAPVHDFGNGYSVKGVEKVSARHDLGAGTMESGGTPFNMTAMGSNSFAKQSSQAESGGTSTSGSVGNTYTHASSTGDSSSNSVTGGNSLGASATTGIGASLSGSFSPGSRGGGGNAIAADGSNSLSAGAFNNAGNGAANGVAEDRGGTLTKVLDGVGAVGDAIATTIRPSAGIQGQATVTSSDGNNFSKSDGVTKTGSNMETGVRMVQGTSSSNYSRNFSNSSSVGSTGQTTVSGVGDLYARHQFFQERGSSASDPYLAARAAASGYGATIEGDLAKELFGPQLYDQDSPVGQYMRAADMEQVSADYNSGVNTATGGINAGRGGAQGLTGRAGSLIDGVEKEVKGRAAARMGALYGPEGWEQKASTSALKNAENRLKKNIKGVGDYVERQINSAGDWIFGNPPEETGSSAGGGTGGSGSGSGSGQGNTVSSTGSRAADAGVGSLAALMATNAAAASAPVSFAQLPSAPSVEIPTSVQPPADASQLHMANMAVAYAAGSALASIPQSEKSVQEVASLEQKVVNIEQQKQDAGRILESIAHERNLAEIHERREQAQAILHRHA